MNGVGGRRQLHANSSKAARANANHNGNGTTNNLNRERLTYTHLNLVGRKVIIKKIDGIVIEGIFVGASADGVPWKGCVLQYVKLLENPKGIKIPTFDSNQKVGTKWEEVVYIFAEDAGGMGDLEQTSNKVQTDTDISRQAVHGGVLAGRKLQATDSAWLQAPKNVSNDMKGKGVGDWDQFKANEEKFGVKSTYDENLYTTPLNRTSLTKEQIEKAEKAAKEIMSQTSSNPHLMEERGHAVKDAWGGDEEARYSSVVRENPHQPLLKIAGALYKAHKSIQDPNFSSEQPKPVFNARLNDVKNTRSLASEITEKGALLFDLLGEERELGVERQQCLRFLDSISNNLNSHNDQQFLEQKLNELLKSASENTRSLEKQCEDLESDKKTLEAKIKKKQSELERNDKRLKSLQSVRPAFMDDYEKLEAELEQHYEIYLEKFRNLDYLQHELEKYSRREKERTEESERERKKIQLGVIEDNKRILREDDENLLNKKTDEEFPHDNRNKGSARPIEHNEFDIPRDKTRRKQFMSDESEISDSEQSNGSDSQVSASGSDDGSLSDEDLIEDDEDGTSAFSEDGSQAVSEDESNSEDDF